MTVSDRDLARRVLAQAWWLTDAPAGLADLLIREGRVARLASGQWAQAEGEPETGLLVIIEGSVQLLREAGPEREVLVGQAGAGAAIGQSMRFGGGPRLATAICAEPSLVLKVSDTALERIARHHPEIWRVVVGLLYAQLRSALQLAADAAGLPPRQRLAARLARLSRPQAGGPILRLSQQALAETVGLTRKTVNGYLGQFASRGLVRLGYGVIEVRDPEGLRRIADA